MLRIKQLAVYNSSKKFESNIHEHKYDIYMTKLAYSTN